MMSREQAQALMHAIHLLRPSWNEEGIYAALAKVKHRDPFDVALAALRAAADDKAKTPGVIPTTGPHWNEAPPKVIEPDTTWRPPQRDECCPAHPGSWANNCSGCAADKHAGDTTQPADPRRPDASEARARVRAELARARGAA